MKCINKNRQIPILGPNTHGTMLAAVDGVELPQIEANGSTKKETANLPVTKMI
jgi:hypothetical protein